jgi:hypothetical protein
MRRELHPASKPSSVPWSRPAWLRLTAEIGIAVQQARSQGVARILFDGLLNNSIPLLTRLWSICASNNALR